MVTESTISLDLISTLQKAPRRCGYGAPYVALIKGGEGRIAQGNCNHWDCPRCRFTLAGYHKHRMIEGANILAETGPLYFWTTTCKGKELDLETADDNYYLWTNRLLSACRANAKRNGIRWEYVQVTERQQRGAAHSHFIHTFCPTDATIELDDDGKPYMFSEWFQRQNVRAGLGPQCRITKVDSAVGVGAYISGYLQKQISVDVWPKKWKRIRYSRGWPDAAESPDWARALLRREDWDDADRQRVTFLISDPVDYEIALHHMKRVQLEGA